MKRFIGKLVIHILKEKLTPENALAGFEKSGHFFFNRPLGYGYDDGINSAIQVCHLLDNQSKNDE